LIIIILLRAEHELRCYYASIGHLMLLDQLAVHIKDRRVLKISSAISGEQHSEAARLRKRSKGLI
jgi:hypothetical protein